MAMTKKEMEKLPMGTPKESKKLIKKAEQAAKEQGYIKRAPEVELVSYTIKAVIPTGSYANVQPEITVKAKNLEEAEDYMIPHINKLFRDFLNKSERRDEFKVVVPAQVIDNKLNPPVEVTVSTKPVEDVHGTYPRIPEMTETPGTVSSVAFLKAQQAVGSCLSSEALQLIESQISKSVKLNHDEKFALLKLVEVKATELFNKK